MPVSDPATYGEDEDGDEYELGAARLLYMLRMAPRWRALADMVDTRWAHLRVIARRISEAFDLETATGVQLDILGAQLGREREGMVDARYRRALRVQRSLMLSSAGTGPTLIAVFREWTGANPLTYRVVPPAYVELTGVVEPEDEALLYEFIAAAAPAGVAFAVFGVSDDFLIADSVTDPITDPGVVDSITDPVVGARVVGYRIA